MEESLLKIRATIYGRGSGIIFDRMSEDVLLFLRERFKVKTLKRGRKELKLLDGESSRPNRDDQGSKLYKNEEGKLGIPAENIFSCLIEAGRRVKNGKRFISTKKSSDLSGFLFLYHDFFPFINHSEVKVYKRMAICNKELVWIWRPRVKQWAADIYFALDTKECHPSVIEELFRIAGTIGIGNHRTRRDKDGRQYGKFMLAEFYLRGEWNISNGEEHFFEKHPKLLTKFINQLKLKG